MARPDPTAEPEASEPEALVLTNWFDPGQDGESYSATVRLTGRRVGIQGRGSERDSFVHEEAIDGIVPGSGPVSISSWIYGLEPGEWVVTVDPVRRNGQADRRGRHWPNRRDASPLRPAAWSWRRWAVSNAPAGHAKTRWALPAPLARIPAVIPGSWLLLGALAVVVALMTQATILGHESISAGPALAVSALALALGLVGAKIWYAILHRRSLRQAVRGGWAVDGFFVVALPVAAMTLLATNMPVGTILDATAPGLFLGVAIGRIGCFFSGCCAGRCTRSHWGIWSSDRRIGARRVPAQLIESLAGLAIAITTWLLIHARLPGVDGIGFVAAVGAYMLVRQVVLRLRAERRDYSWRRSTTISRQGA